jgi:uncharacterized protein (TIGR00730 family)
MCPPTSLPECPPAAPESVKEEERYEVEFADRSFISGPQGRWQELKTLGKIVRDFLRGFRTFHFVGPCVTVFGSARVQPGQPYYELARAMGAGIARLGFTVMTGGGPGIMEAANRGAKEAGGRSVGINIKLPHEQAPNPFVDAMVEMEYFFTRKTLMIKYSYAFVVMPGGVGTMDELFEALTLIQTGKIRNFPVILLGQAYWADIMDSIYRMRDEGMINAQDLDLLYVTDSVEEAVEHLRAQAITQFNLRRVRIPSKNVLLGEHGLE